MGAEGKSGKTTGLSCAVKGGASAIHLARTGVSVCSSCITITTTGTIRGICLPTHELATVNVGSADGFGDVTTVEHLGLLGLTLGSLADADKDDDGDDEENTAGTDYSSNNGSDIWA